MEVVHVPLQPHIPDGNHNHNRILDTTLANRERHAAVCTILGQGVASDGSLRADFYTGGWLCIPQLNAIRDAAYAGLTRRSGRVPCHKYISQSDEW